MRSPAFQATIPRATDALSIFVAAVVVATGVGIAAGGATNVYTGFAMLAAPALVGGYVALSRRPLSRAKGLSLGAIAITGASLLGAALVSGNWLLGAAIPVLGVSTLVCQRFPAASAILLAAVAGTFGSATAFIGFPAQKSADLILMSLWLGALGSLFIAGRRREHPVWFWPGVVVVGAYVMLTAAEIILAEDTMAGLQSFRASIWYLGVVLLFAFAPWSEAVRAKILRGVLVVALIVGSYASLRWAIGPSGKEEAQAMTNGNNFLDGELRPVAPFFTAKELAAWMAMAIPFTAAMALAGRGANRLIALAACLVCILGMVAADVRAGPAAAVPAVFLVLLLYQLSQAFRGRRGATAVVGMMIAVLGGGGAFALTLGDNQDSGRRYQAILEPAKDPSYQARLIKWRAAIEEIEEAPLGHGLGTSGLAQKRYGRYVNIGSVDVDNSYLKIAHEQGFPVLLMFAAGMVLLLAGLARRSVVSLDPARAGPAIAATGTLLAMLVIFYVGTYIEGLPALWGWILVGIGVSQFTMLPREASVS